MNGLGQHLGSGWRTVLRRQGHGGETGDEHDAQIGVAGRSLTRHFNTVHAGHDNVGQQKIPRMVEMLDRLLAIGAGLDLESSALKGASQETPEGIVVFGEKDASHVGLFPQIVGVGRPL